ncbi:UNVERIFIED_CONTAM: hypothetical protein HDU68_002125, partial [Siphonaria sp. JEL0065]
MPIQMDTFSAPIRPKERGNGWDFHIYSRKEIQVQQAQELRRRIIQEFPTLRVRQFREGPFGPHSLPMFEVDVCTPLEFGAFMSWIALNRSGLSVLAHPQTGDDVEDHFTHGIWLGDKVPLVKEALE